MNEEILLTQSGLDALQQEYDYLVAVRRPEVAEHLKEAKSYGDLSENAEYDAAKDEQVQVEERILKLEAMIKNAKVVTEEELTGEQVNMGLSVKIRDTKTKEEFTYQIVGINEADPLNDRISNESPLGKVLIGKKVGDKVEVEIEDGVLTYKILEIFKPE